MNSANTHEPRWIQDPIARAMSIEAKSRCFISGFLFSSYRYMRLRSMCLRVCDKLESGAFYSETLRDILLHYHGVKVGKYSYGSILQPGVLPRGTEIGNYCSVGAGLIVRRRNHPVERLTQHPFFYNKSLGYIKEDTIQENHHNPLIIGHDVWIGDRVTILSGCNSIGNGAVLAAGAVVSKDVEPYSIVGGVPAKTIKMRFDQGIIVALQRSNWWKKSLAELLEFQEFLTHAISPQLLDKLNDESHNEILESKIKSGQTD